MTDIQVFTKNGMEMKTIAQMKAEGLKMPDFPSNAVIKRIIVKLKDKGLITNADVDSLLGDYI